MNNADVYLPTAAAGGGTVFISYAHADNVKPPRKRQLGWVTHFWDQLRWALTISGAPEAKLWLDRYEIEPAEAFTPRIQAALREARLIVPVLSNNWVQRSYCRDEFDFFCNAHDDAEDNIVVVRKDDPPPERVPEKLQVREGYRFFVQDPSGTLQDFYWAGVENRKAYDDLIKKIARYIFERLREPPPSAIPLPNPDIGRRTIYVAVAAQELRDARQRIVNDLEADGYLVVPKANELPDSIVECEAAVREALAQAELVVHILGDNEGIIIPGGEEAILCLQLRLAREEGEHRQLSRILWAPKWLPGRPQDKRDPFVVVNRFGERQPGEEVYGKEVTDLSQLLRRRLRGTNPSPQEVAGPRLLLVAGAAAFDDELVGTLANRLKGSGPQVHPVFFGDPLPAVDSTTPPTILVPWGEADLVALKTLLAGCRALASRIWVLRLPGGDEVAKHRFFADDVYVEKLEALPADRRAMRELLVRLEILDAPAGAQP